MTRRQSILIISISLLAAVTAQGESRIETGDESSPDGTAQPTRIEPPRFRERTDAIANIISKCYSRFARRSDQMGRVVARVNVAPDGSGTVVSVPPGTEAWQEESVRCVVQSLSFEPGTRDGIPVAAEVAVPIAFHIEGTQEVSYLRVATSPEEMERALRHCYPSDSISMATPKFRVDVNTQGRAVKIELVESSGDTSLDEAGVCVLESITFQPTKQNGLAVSSSAIVPVNVRPPRHAGVRTPQP